MISCFRCGECCIKHFPNMLLTKEEIELLKQKTGIQLKVIPVRANRFKPNGYKCCPFYTENECTVYDVRPCQCRLYHCGRLNKDDKALDTVQEIKQLMETNEEYRLYKNKMDDSAVVWGNNRGWNWRKLNGN